MNIKLSALKILTNQLFHIFVGLITISAFLAFSWWFKQFIPLPAKFEQVAYPGILSFLFLIFLIFVLSATLYIAAPSIVVLTEGIGGNLTYCLMRLFGVSTEYFEEGRSSAKDQVTTKKDAQL